jgi:hypothetical protein
VTYTIARLRGPLLGRVLFRLGVPSMKRLDRRNFNTFANAVTKDHAAQSTVTPTLSPLTVDQIKTAAADSLRSRRDS